MIIPGNPIVNKVKDVKTYLTPDGKVKLGLILECIKSNGMQLEIEIPDIDLIFPHIEFIDNSIYDHDHNVQLFISGREEGYISFKINKDEDGHLAIYKVIRRTVTKEDLEKELGYKLNILE